MPIDTELVKKGSYAVPVASTNVLVNVNECDKMVLRFPITIQ